MTAAESVPVPPYVPTTKVESELRWILLRSANPYISPSEVESLTERILPLIASIERAAAEAAWDEGFDTGFDEVLVQKATTNGRTDYRVNPYRALALPPIPSTPEQEPEKQQGDPLPWRYPTGEREAHWHGTDGYGAGTYWDPRPEFGPTPIQRESE